MANLLEIVQTACDEMGLPRPAAVVGNSSAQVRQLLAFANKDGDEIMRWPEDGWKALQTEWIVNVGGATTTTGDVTQGSAIISNIPSTAGIEAGTFAVSGPGQPPPQRVVEVLGPNTVRCQMQSTKTQAGATILFVRDTYALPDDFAYYVGDTWWDRTNHWRMIGPDSPQRDQYQRSGIVAWGPRRHWRQVGKRPNAWRVWPAPFAPNDQSTLVFEYVSTGWIYDQETDTYKSKFTSDSDEPLWPEQMLIMGIKWRFMQAKRLGHEDLQGEWVDFINREFARDGGARVIIAGANREDFLLTNGNIIDGNWPGPTE